MSAHELDVERNVTVIYDRLKPVRITEPHSDAHSAAGHVLPFPSRGVIHPVPVPIVAVGMTGPVTPLSGRAGIPRMGRHSR